MFKNLSPFSQPIPGENYLSDTKNYPWHRPPEITDIDEAIEKSLEKLTSEEGAVGLLTMLELGIDVATITDIFVTKGIGSGKWTPDFAVLLAGPISHIICLMAKGYGIEYDLGIDDKTKPKTASFFKSLREVDKKKAKRVGEEVQSQIGEVQSQAAGFMAGTPKTEGEY
jgi:hypothetical protein